MKIVKFEDGTYGIRKLTLFGYAYLDVDLDYWWPIKYCYKYSRFTTLDMAKEAYSKVKDKGTPT